MIASRPRWRVRDALPTRAVTFGLDSRHDHAPCAGILPTRSRSPSPGATSSHHPFHLSTVPMASPSPERPVRRAKVTYGKRKPVTDDPDATLVPTPAAPVSVSRKYSIEEEIVPDSEPAHPKSDDSDSGSENERTPAQWDWKKKLAALDNDDELPQPPATSTTEDATMVDVRDHTSSHSDTDNDNDRDYAALGTSLTALPGSPHKDDSHSASASAVTSTRSPRRVIDSSPATVTATGESQSSPAQFPINTPLDVSPESPPSSPPAEDDQELPMTISASSSSRSLSKGKGRRSVPPLAFDEGSATASHSRKSSQSQGKDGHSRRSSNGKEKTKKTKVRAITIMQYMCIDLCCECRRQPRRSRRRC